MEEAGERGREVHSAGSSPRKRARNMEQEEAPSLHTVLAPGQDVLDELRRGGRSYVSIDGAALQDLISRQLSGE